MKRIIHIAMAGAAAGTLLSQASGAALVNTTPAQDRLNTFSSTLGYEFTPSSALSVSALGFSDLPSADDPHAGDGLEQDRSVSLWDSNGVLLASVTVPAGTVAPLINGFRYWSMQTSVRLEAGRTYILGAYYNRESDDRYTADNGSSSLAALGSGRSALGQTFPDGVGARVFGPNLLADDDGLVSQLYEIVSGSYIACCGIGGDIIDSLPNDSQRFVRWTVDAQNFASMAILGADRQTVFNIIPCPVGVPVYFNFEFGLVFSNYTVFHVDPGPPPIQTYWNYTVSNSADSLRIDGVLGTAGQQCIDLPTQFAHSNVVAVATPSLGPRLSLLQFSQANGARLFVQGQAGRTNVIEASTNLTTWTAVHTNVMPFAECPICPFTMFEDPDSTNFLGRFYRAFEVP